MTLTEEVTATHVELASLCERVHKRMLVVEIVALYGLEQIQSPIGRKTYILAKN